MKLQNKLSLNRETLGTLSDRDVDGVAAGATLPCPTRPCRPTMLCDTEEQCISWNNRVWWPCL